MARECHPEPVDLSDDLPPPRRPLFFPVVIATVFLSIIGISAGLVLSSWHDDGTGTGTAPPPVVPGTTATAAPPDPVRGACRPETQSAAQLVGAAGTLVQVLYLRTATSEVYICQDQAGSLYYHANNGGDAWIENETALFLPNVTRDGGGFAVEAGNGTAFSVTRKRLLITHTDGREEVQPAV
jgi:hypothetical protein